MTGLPKGHAHEVLLGIFAKRNVSCSLVLVQINNHGAATGKVFAHVAKLRDARGMVGIHYFHHAPGRAKKSGQARMVVSAPLELCVEDHEYLCVKVKRNDEGVLSSSRQLTLADTMGDGARITGSMAAAAVDELLGASSDDATI